MKSQAVLFDFGGTLDADGTHWSSRFYSQYRRHGIIIDRRTFDQAFVHADRVIARRNDMADLTLRDLLHTQVQLQMHFLGLQAPQRAAEIVQDCHDEAKAIITRNAGTLSQLSNKYRLGVVSNFSGNLMTVCREFGLDRLFEVILDSKIVGFSKPDHRLYQLALEKLGCVPGNCWFVGDSLERDILPAKALGLRTIWLQGTEPRPCPDPAKADFTIAKLTELLLLPAIWPPNGFSANY